MNFSNTRIVVDPNFTETILPRLPRRRTKRVMKKWKRRFGITRPRKDAIIYPGYIVCHPEYHAQLVEGLKQMDAAWTSAGPVHELADSNSTSNSIYKEVTC